MLAASTGRHGARERESIYFRDPNGLQLECCHLTRPFQADDAVPRVRFRLEGRVKKHLDGTQERTSR